jgi:hypothetical protein
MPETDMVLMAKYLVEASASNRCQRRGRSRATPDDRATFLPREHLDSEESLNTPNRTQHPGLLYTTRTSRYRSAGHNRDSLQISDEPLTIPCRIDKSFTDQAFRRAAISRTRLCVLVWGFPFLSTGKIMPAGTTNSVAPFGRRTRRYRDREGLGESRDLQH